MRQGLTVALFVFSMLAMLGVARCQTAGSSSTSSSAPAVVSAFALPENWAGAGMQCGTTRPACSGWVSYAKLITQTGPLYSYSSYDVVFTKLGIPTTSARTGFATTLKQFGRFFVFGYGTAGVATSGAATIGSYSGGGMALYLFKNGMTAEAGVRYMNVGAVKQPIYELGFGKAW